MTEKGEITREEDERIWIIPAMLETFISLGGIIYMIYLKSINVIPSYNVLVLYTLLWVSISLAICFGTYEIVFSLKIKKPLLFHLKRFLSRTIFTLGYILYMMAFWSLLSPLISWRHALLLTLILTSLTLAILVAIPKTRYFIKKFTEGE